MNAAASIVPSRHGVSGGLLIGLACAATLAVWPWPGVWMGAESLRALVHLFAALGFAVSMSAQELLVGTLAVPWSDDCAGVSYFAILPLIACWQQWQAGVKASVWRVLLRPWLLAAAVNSLRVASIVVCRQWLQPEVESPQMHQFLGLVWLLPALWLLLPSSRQWLPTLHLAGVLALLTPQMQAPGGLLIALCTVVVLGLRLTAAVSSSRIGLVLKSLWALAAVWILGSRMESLWLPWLLLSPGLGLTTLPLLGWLVLPGTVPLVAMQQPWSWLVLVPIALTAMAALRARLTHSSVPQPHAPHTHALASPWRLLPGSLAVLLPFFAMGIDLHARRTLESPIASLHPEVLSPTHQSLHLDHQPADMRVDWFAPQAGGRHHTLSVCMAYRGEHLLPVPHADEVWTDGHVWRREYFLHEGRLLPRYRDYLWRTFWPGSSTGVHLIFSARHERMSAPQFAEASAVLAHRILEHQNSPPSRHDSR